MISKLKPKSEFFRNVLTLMPGIITTEDNSFTEGKEYE